MFLNLCAGLDRIGVPYRVNDYRHVRRNPSELACIIGKPFVLDLLEWENPIMFGAAIYSHPLDDPDLLAKRLIPRILVPGPWMESMCRPYWGARVAAWPVGIDTELWHPAAANKDFDVLIYDKVRWEHDQYERSLLAPIRMMLRAKGRSFMEIRYGSYCEEEFRAALARCRAMIFLCEHETQGIAYQQALSAAVPILAWDRGGPWQDPSYYPHKVVFSPVSSVPYWDDRCGLRFPDLQGFEAMWDQFWEGVQGGRYLPRDYIVEHLTLEICAQRYVELARASVQ